MTRGICWLLVLDNRDRAFAQVLDRSRVKVTMKISSLKVTGSNVPISFKDYR